MRVVMVASESLPFAKVGGLGDVVYSLSKKLVNKNVKVSIVIPFYKCIKENIISSLELYQSFNVKMSWRNQICDIYHLIKDKIDYYFIGNDYYFFRDKIYGEKDDFERFSFFGLSAYELIFKYLKRVDIVHIHDHQGSSIPLLYYYNHQKEYDKKRTRFMLTIHNPCFQGICQRSDLSNYFNLPESLFDDGLARLDGQVNLLKSAIMLSDKVTTVSPSHKCELLNGISSYGLEKVLPFRNSDLVGILNGLNEEEFNPKNDPYIYLPFSKNNVINNKKYNKQKLCQELNFVHKDYPLFCIVSRITKQKGFGIIIQNIEKILKFKLNLVILGQGDPDLEHQLSFYCMNKDNVSLNIKYSNELAHKIYASSDFILMPSLYEPCGISQMIALKYGTIPLCTKVGGLKDTIISYNQLNIDKANGLLFDYDSNELLINLIISLNIFEKKREMNKLIHNAMNANFSWNKACEEYLRLYKQMLQKNID
ncbi:MAG: glycogen synthase [Bacillales bacterium]|nr:glycogen synthase [Bacillales bacterium]